MIQAVAVPAAATLQYSSGPSMDSVLNDYWLTAIKTSGLAWFRQFPARHVSKFDCTDCGFLHLSGYRAGSGRQQMVARDENSVVFIDSAPHEDGGHTLRLQVASAEAEIPFAVDQALREKWPTVPQPKNAIKMTFHFGTDNGPQEHERFLVAPWWKEILGNYSGDVRDRLAPLMAESWRPQTGGKLFIWHGPAGTGKTFALRSLVRQWGDWCDASYIVDPERFFSETAYMFEVILESTDQFTRAHYQEEDWDPIRQQYYPKEKENAETRWRLIVLEDCGEFLTKDAQQRTGQALQRLLNSADGLIGQGLRVLFLITTNEDIGQMHPAVTRPGRMAVPPLQFGEFTAAEGSAWLAAQGTDIAVARPQTLATLYSITRGEYSEPAPKAVGFRP